VDYFELTVDLKTVEPWRDILIAELAETGFESFVETNSGFLGYIPENLYKPEMIEPVLQIESVETYAFKKIEDQNWNATGNKILNPFL
jgi:ribosomal protein L11 methyltransferase